MRPDPPAREAIPQRPQERRGRGRARRFDRQPGMLEQEAHGRNHFGVLDAHDLVEAGAAQRVGNRQGIRRAEAVGDGVDLLDRLRRAGQEAAVHRVRAEGLDAEDPAVGLREPDRRRNARREPAPADRHDHGLEIRRLLDEFESERAGALARCAAPRRDASTCGPPVTRISSHAAETRRGSRPRTRSRRRSGGTRRRGTDSRPLS